MTPEVDTLIKLFAENKIADIQKDIAPLILKYLNKDWKIAQEPFFPKNYDLLTRLKQTIEEIDANPEVTNQQEQIKGCLISCWMMSNFNTDSATIFQYKMEVYKKLIQYSYQVKWKQAQMEYFNEVSDIFSEYNNYFISYTNHFARIINTNYQYVFGLFNAEDYSQEDLLRKNLLALAMNKYFNINNLRKGFFDRDSIRLSDLISEKVRQNAGKSIALVQLLSKASFEWSDTNWSYIEYCTYLEGRKKFKNGNGYKPGFEPLPFFILIGKNPYPGVIPPPYKNWISEVQTRLHCDLTATPKYDDFRMHIDKLITDVIQFREQMIVNVPN